VTDSYDTLDYDALVVGAGAGGLAAAARLNAQGLRTLLVERRAAVGGRASTVDIDGFRVNTGALIIEQGGENGRLFSDIGVAMGTRVPKQPLVLRIGNRTVPVMSGPTGLLSRGLLTVAGGIGRRWPRLRPARRISVENVLNARNAGSFVRGLTRNLTTAVFAAEPSDVEAAVFFDYFTKPNALDTYAMHPEGGIGPWRALSDHFERTGGTLWLSSEVTDFSFDDENRVNGASIRRPGGTVHIGARVVVSNAGPVATVRLCGDANLPPGYAEDIRAQSNPSTLITVNFASRRPLTAALTGVVFFGPTRRLAYAAELTATCPEMAPAGWHLYAGASTPHPATGAFDEEAEVELLKQDLREHFPGFDEARVLSVQICAGEEWPAQRAVAGRDLPQDTPVANLFNVGDGVREWATGGQSACVQSARLVTERIAAQLALGRSEPKAPGTGFQRA
jgi:phytoene desaturase